MQKLRFHPSLTPLLSTLLAIGCGAALPEKDSPGQQNVVFGSRVHKMPIRDSSSINPSSAPAGAHLTYYGGRVVSNVQVVVVLYGTGSYLSQVTSTASPSISTFYGGVTNSAYYDWLTEYNTNITAANGQQGTNQSIGHGTFLQQVQIAPSSANNGSTISDSSIQSELAAQIQAGRLPAPTRDAAGNNNTYYAIFFPHGKTITQGGSSSCVAGGFCAYHGTIANISGFGEVYYGVHPDMQAGSGCDTGCGSGTPFQNYCSVASHELVEATTDAEVGIAATLAPPLAWYDNTNGEIGDICNAQQGTVVGGDGVTYTVQKEFSNTTNDCIVQRATAANDFSISANPSSTSIAQGSSGSVSIATATTSGSAQTVNLTVSGQPSGVTATLSPTSVTSGQSSTLSISVSSSAAAGTYTLTITGTAASGSHATSVSLTVTSSGGGGGGGWVNGGFETGNLSGWTASGASQTVVNSGCHSGTYCARLGATTPTNGDSTISQTATAPTGTTGVTFWWKMTCPDTVTYDWATATLKDNTTGATSTVLAKICTTNSWSQVNASATAGHSYTLTLVSRDDNYPSDPSYTLYDDVAFTTGGGGGGGGGGIVNGGFETGNLSGWTASGAATGVTTTAHTGSYAAILGSTSPTDGDSTIAQTFTVPSGKSSLSFWYAVNCPDTVTYDWFTGSLKDNTSGTTTTLVGRTCPTSYTWTNQSTSVTAGHSYTITLTSHDDNYPGDPTYSLVDDVTLN